MGLFAVQEVSGTVILRQCSRGCEPQKEALISTYSAWFRADGVRVAYKQKLCLTCVASKLAPLYVECQKPEQSCPMCHISTTTGMDPVYISFYPKGVGMMAIEAPTCGACAVMLRVFLQDGATPLEDRQASGEGPLSGPSPTASQTLAALGLSDYGTR